MKFVYCVAFVVASIFLGATKYITVRDMYVGATIFLVAEYIVFAIERKK